MKVSLQWLRTLVPALKASDEEIVHALRADRFEVLSKTTLAGDLEPVAPQPGELTPGAAVEQEVPAAFDTILDVADVGRADVLGHVGFAREVAAMFDLAFLPPGVDAPARAAEGAADALIDVDVYDPDGCPHFGLVVVDDVRVGPSPLWLRVRLHALGHSPCNSVTDLTRLVMLESGHPVSAFDLDRLAGNLRVRRAEPGEVIELKEGRVLTLAGDDLVVADDTGPIALAGVAAAARAQVRETTKRVVLTSGWFDPRRIAATADRLQLDTEDARRYRRGVDRNDAAEVLAQAGALATRLANGAAVPGAIHVFEAPWEAPQIVLRGAAIGSSTDNAGAILESLGFEVVPLHGEQGQEGLHVSVPSFRLDVRTEQDLVGELERIDGVRKSVGID